MHFESTLLLGVTGMVSVRGKFRNKSIYGCQKYIKDGTYLFNVLNIILLKIGYYL